MAARCLLFILAIFVIGCFPVLGQDDDDDEDDATTTITAETTTTTTTTTNLARVQGSLVLNVSDTLLVGDTPVPEIEAALANAIADMAAVNVSVVFVTLAEADNIVTVEYTLSAQSDEAVDVVARINSTDLNSATTVVAQQLSDAGFDGDVEVISFSAEIVDAPDAGDDARLLFILLSAGVGAIGGLLMFLCCCCLYWYCCRGGDTEGKNKTSKVVEP